MDIEFSDKASITHLNLESDENGMPYYSAIEIRNSLSTYIVDVNIDSASIGLSIKSGSHGTLLERITIVNQQHDGLAIDGDGFDGGLKYVTIKDCILRSDGNAADSGLELEDGSKYINIDNLQVFDFDFANGIKIKMHSDFSEPDFSDPDLSEPDFSDPEEELELESELVLILFGTLPFREGTVMHFRNGTGVTGIGVTSPVFVLRRT